MLSGAKLLPYSIFSIDFVCFLLLGKSIDFLCVVTQFSYHIHATWQFSIGSKFECYRNKIYSIVIIFLVDFSFHIFQCLKFVQTITVLAAAGRPCPVLPPPAPPLRHRAVAAIAIGFVARMHPCPRRAVAPLALLPVPPSPVPHATTSS